MLQKKRETNALSAKLTPRARRKIALSLLLAVALTVSACTVIPQEPADPTQTKEESHMSDTYEPVTDEQTLPETEMATEVTAEAPTENAETEPETQPALSEHDKLMIQLGYNKAEKAALAETAVRMTGLRATYYADRAMTETVSTEVVKSAELNIRKGSGISAVVLEGFITFDTENTYTLTFEGAADSDRISLIKGEHHIEAGTRMKLRAVAGAQYGIKLKATWDGVNQDATLSLSVKGEGSYTLTVGRPLLEHASIAITPILDIPLRDTFICTGPDGNYYMTGTTGPDFWDNNYVIHIYRSADLVTWEDLGVVWDFRTDATWAKEISKEDRVPVWAPELAYVNGNWYMTYSMGFWDGFSGGVLVSTTGKPEGPYVDTSERRLVDNIDGSLFTDDDGTTYFIYKDGLIAPMKEDLSGFTGKFKPLYAADGLPVGFEGCSILKHNGKYYLTAATYNQSYDENGNLITTYDSMIAVSDSLYGPYSETRLLLRNGGHNNLFVDREGNVWTTLFAPSGNLGFNCKPAIVKLTEDERGILSVSAPDSEG